MKANFSPNKLAALNTRYVNISMKCNEIDKLLNEKYKECIFLENKIKSLENTKKKQEEYNRKHVMCMIKDEKAKASPSPSPVKRKITNTKEIISRNGGELWQPLLQVVQRTFQISLTRMKMICSSWLWG